MAEVECPYRTNLRRESIRQRWEQVKQWRFRQTAGQHAIGIEEAANELASERDDRTPEEAADALMDLAKKCEAFLQFYNNETN